MSITIVQSCTGANASGGAGLTATATFGSNITAGNAVIVAFTYSDGGVATTCAGNAISDGPGDTFTNLQQTDDLTNAQAVCIFWTASSNGGSKTVTLTGANTPENNGNLALVCIEVSGLSGTDTGAGQNTSGTTSTNGCNTTAFSTSTNGDLVVAAFMDTAAGSATWTAGTSPLTFTVPANGQSSFSLALEYAIWASHGSVNPAATESAANTYIGVGFSFKAAGGGPTVDQIMSAINRPTNTPLWQPLGLLTY